VLSVWVVDERLEGERGVVRVESERDVASPAALWCFLCTGTRCRLGVGSGGVRSTLTVRTPSSCR
jgi:hypothetical protein